MAKKKIKYLSNSELLYEINESKKSYCYYLDDCYKNYDLIILSLSNLEDGDIIEEAKTARAKRLNTLAVRHHLLAGLDTTDVKNAVLPEHIKEDELVFRVMTYEHIPPAEKIRNTRNESGHYHKIPFPPFKQYSILDDKVTEVARSHWVNGLENGWFAPNEGAITHRLADMFMKLAERYSTKPGWRSYTYRDEMIADALVQFSAVALKFNESKSNNPFAYYTQMIKNSFIGRLNSEKKSRTLRDNLLVQGGAMPSFTAQLDDIEKQHSEMGLETLDHTKKKED